MPQKEPRIRLTAEIDPTSSENTACTLQKRVFMPPRRSLGWPRGKVSARGRFVSTPMLASPSITTSEGLRSCDTSRIM